MRQIPDILRVPRSITASLPGRSPIPLLWIIGETHRNHRFVELSRPRRAGVLPVVLLINRAFVDHFVDDVDAADKRLWEIFAIDRGVVEGLERLSEVLV